MTIEAAGFTNLARAASFACTDATHPQEQLICSDTELSKLDEEMSQGYDGAISGLTPADAAILRTNQRAWLKALRAGCKAEAPSAATCLREAYRRRVEEFAGHPAVVGPYVFVTVTRNWTEGPDDICEEPSRTRAISYPQFMTPLAAEQAAWNEATAAFVDKDVKEWLDSDMGCSPEFFYDISAVAAMDGFLATSTGVSWMGMSHFWGSGNNTNLLLASRKILRAEDLFADATAWEDALGARALELIQREAPDLAVTPTEAEGFATSGGNWIISRETLAITLNLKDRYGRLYPNLDLVVPWRDLKPYLRPNLPIALKLD